MEDEMQELHEILSLSAVPQTNFQEVNNQSHLGRGEDREGMGGQRIKKEGECSTMIQTVCEFDLTG